MEPMTTFQDFLSKAQALPIFGPIVVSPIKALTSTVELVAGIAGVILFGSLTCLTLLVVPRVGFACLEATYLSLRLASHGKNELVYSLVNMISLGLIGAICENNKRTYRLL
jgi:hypothetical protein